MNTLKGHIKSIATKDDLMLVSIALGSCEFKAVILNERPNSFEVGSPVKVIFKETEVVLGTNLNESVSIRNRVHGKIKNVEKGQLLSRVVMDTEEGVIRAIVTTEAVQVLKLEMGSSIVAMIKTNEVMLSN